MSAGDINEDGFEDVILGSPYAMRDGQQVGAAYLFFGPVSGTLSITEADVVFEGTQPGSLFGHQVGDATYIGPSTHSVLISAPGYDHGDKVDVGAAYLWYGLSD